MENVMLAKLLGLLLVIMSVGFLVNFDILKKVSKELNKSYALEIIISFMRTLLGLVLVLSYNVWTGPYLLVTVVGWLILGVGVSGLLLPHQIMAAVPAITKKETPLKVTLGITLVLGAVLTYFGFFM